LKTALQKVREFHEHLNIPNANLEEERRMVDSHLFCVGVQLKTTGRDLATDGIERLENGDIRSHRSGVLVEEVGELLAALSKTDEVEVADALGDVLYVVLSIAENYKIPIAAIFDEIHRSNMTKNPVWGIRNRWKGPDFEAPNIEEALQRGREMEAWERKLDHDLL
jgi:predicted HAD superfamily Cof-like phosphohydrolase